MVDDAPNEPPGPPIRRKRRWLRRAVIGLAVLALGFLFVLHLPPVQERLVSTALRSFRATQSLDLTWRDVRFNLVTRSAHIDGLRLGARGAPAPLVAADQVAVRFPFGLFRGRLDGLDVTLVNGVVNLTREHGKWATIPAAWLESTPGRPARTLPAFRALRFQRVDVVYDDRDARFRSETRGLQVNLLPTGSGIAGDLAGDLTPGSTTTIRWEPRGTVLSLRGGRARFSPAGAGVDKLQLDAPEGRISSDVRFAFKGTDRFGLTARADLKADQLAGWVQALETARGDLQVDISMPAAAGAPAFADIVATSPQMVWRELAVNDLRAAGPLETGAVTLNTMAMRLGPGTLAGNARLAWTSEGDNHAELTGQNIDLAATLRTLVPKSPAVARFTPGALVGGRFTGKWQGWKSATLDGTLDTNWRARPLGGPERYALSGRLRARFAKGPWTLDLDSRVDDALNVAGRWTMRASAADFADWPIDGVLALDGATPGTLRTALRLFDMDEPADLSTADGRVQGTVTLDRVLGNPTANVDLTGSLQWPDQPVIDTRAQAVITADQVNLTSFEATSGPSRATSALTIDLNRDTIDGQFAATAAPVESWLRRFDLSAPVTGPVDVTGRLSGPLSRIVVDADVAGGPLVLAGQAFDRVTTAVKYDGDAVTASNLVLARGTGSIEGQIAWTRQGGGLDGTFEMKALSFDTQVPGIVAADGEAAGQLRAVASGRATIGGTVDEPRLDLAISTPALTLDTRAFGPIKIEARTETAAVTRIAVDAADLGAKVSGTVDLAGTRAFDLSGTIDTANSPLAVDTRGVAIELGAMTLQARATGTLSEPVLETADVTIQRLDGAVTALSPSASGPTTVAVEPGQADTPAPLLPFSVQEGSVLRYRPQLFTLENAAISTGETRVTANGIFGSPDDTLTVAATGRLQDLRPLVLALAPNFDDPVFEGPIRAGAIMSGTFERPTVKGSFDLDGARLGDGKLPAFEDVWVRIGLEGEQIRLDLIEGRWQGAHLAVSGMVPTWFARLPGSARTSAQAALSGHIDEVTLKVLEPFVSPDAMKATTFQSKLSFAFTASEPTLNAVAGDLRIDEAILRSRELGWAQRSPARLRLERGVLTLAPWTVGAPWSTRTAFTLGGSVTLPDGDTPASMDAAIKGEFDLRTLGLLFAGYRPSGTAVVAAKITGPVTGPSVDGALRITDGALLIRNPRFVFEDLNGEAHFKGDRLTIDGLTANVNGGTIELSGSMRQPGRGTPDGALSIVARGMLLEIPRGLRSAIDADLSFSERPDKRFGLTGKITIADAAYRETLLVTGGIMNLISPGQDQVVVSPETERRPEWLVMDLRVVADDSVVIDTTYGRFSLGGNLRVQGTPATPRLTGTAAIAPGGEVYVGGRTYQVEVGLLEFRNPTSLRPDIRFNARTSVSGYDITLDIQTRGGVTETRLQSDPPLPEDDVASLLLSGQRYGEGDTAEAVTQQLAAALSGEIVGAVGRAIGFDSVRVEQSNPGDTLFDASLIKSDTNPAQRLTFTKRVFPDVTVTVSQSLRQSGDVTWIIGWEPISGVELRFVQLDDQDKSYEVRHDISFGGGVKRKFRERRRTEDVRQVTVTTTGAITEADVRALLKLKEGKAFDFYEWQGDRNRVQKWLGEHGFYEARATGRRNPSTPPPLDATTRTPVDLIYHVDSGPRTELRVTGIEVPKKIREALVTTWVDVPIDAVLEEEFSNHLRPWLAEQDYLQSEIKVEISRQAAAAAASGAAAPVPVKIVTVAIRPGPKTAERRIVYTGNEGLKAGDLDKAIELAGLKHRVWVRPTEAQAVVLATYRRNGYLAAQVTVSEPRFEDIRAELPIRIDEGPRFRAGTVRMEGVSEVPGVKLTPPVREGTVITDRLVADAVRELERTFRRAGYRGTRVTASSTNRNGGETVDLVFNVLLGQRARLEGIRIAGNADTSPKLIEKTMSLDPGEPLSFDRLNRARDRLYDTGLFRTVSLETAPVPDADGRPIPAGCERTSRWRNCPSTASDTASSCTDPNSSLFDPKWGAVDPGVVADLTRRGLFGRGLTGGIGAGINPSEQTVRAYISSRTFFGLPAQTNLYVGVEDEKAASTGIVLDSRKQFVTFDQRVRYRRLFQLGYGYSFEVRTFDFLVQLPTLPAPIPVEVKANIGRLLTSIVIDDRDDVVNTRQGPFHSSSFELGPTALGSTLPFKKYLGQQFYFVPWKKVTMASAARLEVSGGPGRGLITTERLRVGGAYTVRGYEDDTLSLANISGSAPGTTTVIVLNQEVRFMMTRRLQGAGFWDYAHIYGETGDFAGLRLRNGVGAGARLLLPFIIVRVDYGYPIQQDQINNKGRWYFAIGQTF